MKSERFYKFSILILVIVNVGMMVFMWVNRPPKMPPPHEQRLSLMLGLKGEKQSKVDDLEKKHHELKRELVHRDVELHEELFNEFNDRTKADSLLKLIDLNKTDIEKMTYDFFADISTYCDAEQKRKLNEFLTGAFIKMRNPGPPPPPGRP